MGWTVGFADRGGEQLSNLWRPLGTPLPRVNVDQALLAGVVTTASGGRGRNEAAVFNERGEELKRYQTIHPFCIGGEKDCY